MWTVIFSQVLYEQLIKFLFSTEPNENGCFLLANSYKLNKKNVILVTDILKPNDDSWNKSGEHSLEPSSSFINQCVVTADNKNRSLVFVHTHPHPFHPPKFSAIDEKSNKRLFANLSQILPERPFGSFVFSQSGIYGVIFDDGKKREVSDIKISGKILSVSESESHDISKLINSKFDRQIKAIGPVNQRKLQNLIVTIVGVGGTGSPLAIQLARMGVKKLRIIDMDVVDETNLTRIYGSKQKDVGKSKVEVLRKHIKEFSKIEIDAIKADVTKDDVADQIVDSDMIFSCTDNLTSRAVLNDISIQYFIPLIDVGCRIHLDSEGKINQAIMKIQVVTPDSACLWCSGTLDGKIILQEKLSDQEKEKLAREGYYEKIENQPSIISVTTMASSMAVNKLLNMLGIFGTDYNSLTQIELKDGFMIDSEPEINKSCICRKKMGSADLLQIREV